MNNAAKGLVFVKKWGPLVILAAASFLMTLDQAVMNVSISNLVADLHTTVTAIQGVITLYSLVMAMFMVIGGKIGDLVGRRRAFIIGLVIYGLGSATTALAPNVVVLGIGWSGLEGLGAALVLPALAALIAGNYEGRDRITAYSVIGGVAGVAIAVGPIVGGWATTELSWRVVFVGEVIVVAAILACANLLRDAPSDAAPPKLDVVGGVLVSERLSLESCRLGPGDGLSRRTRHSLLSDSRSHRLSSRLVGCCCGALLAGNVTERATVTTHSFT